MAQSGNGSVGRPIVPREHGAWAVLYGAFLAGVGVAGEAGAPVLLLLLAVTAAVLANGPLGLLLRPEAVAARPAERRRVWTWLLAYGALFGVTALPLLLVYRMAFLLPLGMGAAGFLLLRATLVRGREDRSLAGELLGTAGLTLAGPVAHAVAAGGVQPVGILLWLLLFLFFASGVFYVRMRIRGMLAGRQGLPVPRPPAFWSCLGYHLLLLAAIPTLAILELVPWAICLAYAPVLWRAAVGLRRHHVVLPLKRLGWSEVAQTAAFVLLLVGALRLAPLG